MAERRSLGRRCRFIPRHPAPERTASSRRPAGMRWRLARAGQDLRTQTPVPFAQEPCALPKTSSCLNSPTSLHLLYRPLRATSVRSRAALAPYPVSPRRLSKLRRGLPSSAIDRRASERLGEIGSALLLVPRLQPNRPAILCVSLALPQNAAADRSSCSSRRASSQHHRIEAGVRMRQRVHGCTYIVLMTREGLGFAGCAAGDRAPLQSVLPYKRNDVERD